MCHPDDDSFTDVFPFWCHSRKVCCFLIDDSGIEVLPFSSFLEQIEQSTSPHCGNLFHEGLWCSPLVHIDVHAIPLYSVFSCFGGISDYVQQPGWRYRLHWLQYSSTGWALVALLVTHGSPLLLMSRDQSLVTSSEHSRSHN